MRRGFGLFLAVGVVCAVVPANASPGGINGFSGQSGNTCNVCHQGGSFPTVTLTGPAAVAPGTVSTYTLTIAVPIDTPTDQKAGGLDVAASGGTLMATAPGTQIRFGELTHTAPKDMDPDRNVIFTFDWQAPVSTGDFTLFAAGNAVNLADGNAGDAAEATTLAIFVGAMTSTPGEASAETLTPLLVSGYDRRSGDLAIVYESGCDTTDTAIYYGPLAEVADYGYSGEVCGLGTAGTFEGFDPGDGSYFFLVVGGNGVDEGSYGKARNAASVAERPPFAGNLCGLVQSTADRCDAP